MQKNGIREIWAQNKQAINGWLSVPNSFTAEVMTTAGYDSLTIDMQHGLIDYQAMTGMLQAIHGTGVTGMVRVPWLDPAHVMKVLDAGAQGIICPMVNSAQDAAQLVDFARYPPHGSRSIGPIRARYMLGGDYIPASGDTILVFAMIETAEAMENLDAIVGTPGLDGVYIGPSDLTMSLSNGAMPVGMDREEPEIVEAIERILKAAHGAGIRACLHTAKPEYARRGLEWGFDLITMSSDIIHMQTSASEAVAKLRSSSS